MRLLCLYCFVSYKIKLILFAFLLDVLLFFGVCVFVLFSFRFLRSPQTAEVISGRLFFHTTLYLYLQASEMKATKMSSIVSLGQLRNVLSVSKK